MKNNHFFLHLAYVFLALPFLLNNILYIRYCLELAFICFIVWSLMNKYTGYTTIIWNSVFLGINSLLIVIELRQNNWNPFPENPLDDIGKIYNINTNDGG